MRTLGILFYTVVLVFIGLLMLLFAAVFSFSQLQPSCTNYINDLLIYIQNSFNARLIIGLSGLVLILISFSLTQLILARFQREKTIAFTTASGEVTIALSAIEDLIKRLTGLIPEIKDLKPDVKVTKKGSIVVDLRLVLKSEVDIPDLTTRLQEITKSKLQEVLGLEEQIIIKIHVAKIISPEDREKKNKDAEKEEPNIPFGGYGRV